MPSTSVSPITSIQYGLSNPNPNPSLGRPN